MKMVNKHCPSCGLFGEQIDVYKNTDYHYVLVFYCKQCDGTFRYVIGKHLD